MINTIRKLLPVLAIGAFLATDLSAEVFSLWPYTPGGGGESSRNITDVLPAKRFWKETVNVNGTDLELHISLAETTLEDAAAVLRKHYPGAPFALNRNSFLIDQPLKNGGARRVYLLNLSGVNPLLQFSLELPAGRKKLEIRDWPPELPVFDGAENLSVMRFPARKATFASFYQSNVTRPQILNDMGARLKALGWTPATSEIANVFEASGEVFVKEKPLELLLLGVNPADRGRGVSVTIYTRPLEKR